jgi:hypothetical protein
MEFGSFHNIGGISHDDLLVLNTVAQHGCRWDGSALMQDFRVLGCGLKNETGIKTNDSLKSQTLKVGALGFSFRKSYLSKKIESGNSLSDREDSIAFLCQSS